MARRKRNQEFTEQDQINMEAQIEQDRIEAEQKAEERAEKQRAKALKKTGIGRMQHDRNRRR